MKNKKGFTLVELLAVIVLLGILSVYAIPQIFKTIDKSRDKVYVEDATKLVSKARYAMNAKSGQMVKPSQEQAIVLGMGYLESGEFANPPGSGKYLKDYSYVVVLNYDGKYYYAVTIVEKVDGGGFKGVQLATEKDVLGKNALGFVKGFSAQDLLYVDPNSKEKPSVYVGDKLVKVDSIKALLGSADDGVWASHFNSISNIYH